MIMGQTKLIHEHYESKAWASLLSAFLILILAILNLFVDKEQSMIDILIAVVLVVPFLATFVMDLYWRNKPVMIVCNDRLEIRKPLSFKRVEYLYSDIRNVDMVSGQLLIWSDEISAPSRYNLGVKEDLAQETFNMIRTSYDKYNQERGISPIPLDKLSTKRNIGTKLAMIMVFTIAIMIVVYKIID